MDLLELLDQVPDPSVWLMPTGVALAVLAVLIIGLRARRRAGAFAAGRAVTLPLVLAWEAQGLHQLAVQSGLDGPAAVVMAGLMAAILATLALGADEHHRRHGTLGWPGRLVWLVGVPMGAIVAMTADSAAVAALRVALPALAAMLWWVAFAPPLRRTNDPGSVTRREGSWRWTPRRIGVALGLLDPTDSDLSQVHAERQIRRLTSTAHRLHHGTRLLRGLRAAKLRRLGLDATPEMVAEVHRRVALVHEIERLTDPTQQPVMSAPQADMSAPDAGHGTGHGADTEPDMERTSAGHDRADITTQQPVMSAPGRRTSTGRGSSKRAGRAAKAADTVTADHLRELLDQHPDMTQRQLAQLVGLSDRQVRRILRMSAPKQADMSAPEAGHGPDTEPDMDGGHVRLNGHAMSG